MTDICTLVLAGPDDNSPLEFISEKRLARLRAIEQAALALYYAEQEELQEAYERLVAVIDGENCTIEQTPD